MNRLDFRLPYFRRTAWVSDAARAAWRGRLAAACDAWHTLVLTAIADGAIGPAIVETTPAQWFRLQAIGQGVGVAVEVLEVRGASAAIGPGQAPTRGPTRPFFYRVLLADPAQAAAVASSPDRLACARAMVDAPPCCQVAQAQQQRAGFDDPTWQHVTGPITPISGSALAHGLLAPLGIAALPYAACRADCAASIARADALLARGDHGGHRAAIADLRHVLDWSIEWSALHGIAELKTPVVKVAYATDATAAKHVLRREGRSMPSEAARGIVFPYLRPTRLLVTDSARFQRGLDHARRDP